MMIFCTPGSVSRALSSMVVLPSSVSTSVHSARASVVDPIGRKRRLDRQIRATGLEDRDDGGHPVQVPLGHHRDHALAAQPTPRSARASRLACALSPGRSTAGRGARPRRRPGASARAARTARGTGGPAASARPGQPVELEAQLLVRQQARPPVLGARVGDHQREGGEVVAGDPPRRWPRRARRCGSAGAARAGRRGRERHPEHGVLGEVSADLAGVEAADRVELGLERRPGHAQLTLELVHREVPVLEQVRLDPSGVPSSSDRQSGLRW